MGFISICFFLINLKVGNTIATLFATIICAVLYIISLIIVGGLNQRDLTNVPMVGNLLMKLLVLDSNAII